MGSGAGAGVYSHPFSNLPVTQGCYYAQIITSDQGNNLDCFADVNVVNWTCPSPPSYTYNGPGGAAATREFEMDIMPSTTHIKIAQFDPLTVPDLLEVIYNGVTLYSSTNPIGIINAVFVPITYVAGQSVKFKITNQTPGQNTIWSIGSITCCAGLPSCPTASSIPNYTSVTCTVFNCQSDVILNVTGGMTLSSCSNCNILDFGVFSLGGCNLSTISTSACADGSVTVSSPSANTKKIDYVTSAVYLSIKSQIQAITNSNHYVTILFKNVLCASDGTLNGIAFFPLHSTITYDDVLFTITVFIPTANPYNQTSCVNCASRNYSLYEGSKSIINQTSNNGTYPSTFYLRIQTYVGVSVSQDNLKSLRLICNGVPCTADISKNYNFFLRDVNCPCQSWQLFYDSDNNGTYETLITQAAGWNGSCI
jgi:hypothetical protein